MAKSLLDLANKLENLATGFLAKEASRCAVEAALTIHHQLTLVTPVDTSTALSNWDVSLGSLNGEFHEAYVEGKKGSTKLRSMKFANQTAEDVLKDKVPGQFIFISNFAPYIRNLNNGSSKQAPAGFVEQAILVGKIKIKNFKVVIK